MANQTDTTHTDDLVYLDIDYKTGWAKLSLNRAKALQALNTKMVVMLKQYLAQIAEDDGVYAVWLESTTPKAFCAGGDVRRIRQAVIENEPQPENFFAQEYALDLYMHEYSKPIVTWGEGYIMGGGMGMLMATPFRIVTPKSKLAMPEVNIGLFPDVGGSRFLASSGTLGLFLGLTGSMLSASDAFMLRWATHICTDTKSSVLEKLENIVWQSSGLNPHQLIDDVLNTIHTPSNPTHLQQNLSLIHDLALGENFMDDYQNLCQLSTSNNEWLKTAGQNIRQGAPSTVALTWLLWSWAHNKTWQAVFALEFELAKWKINHPDFAEGVRARLVDKDLKPQWQHKNTDSLSDILPSLPVTDDEQWQQLLIKNHIKAI